MSLCKAMVMGRLGRDPDVRQTQSGVAVLKFSLATSEFSKDGKGGFNQSTQWHNVVAFRDQAERWGPNLRKGQMVYVEGPLRSEKWTDRDGIERVTWSLHAQKLEFCERRDQSQTGAPPPGAQMYTGPDTYVPNQGAAGAAEAAGTAKSRWADTPIDADDVPF